MAMTNWYDDQHRCWVLEYRYIFEDNEQDEIDNDLRISWIVNEIASNWPRATRMSYDQWYWYDRAEMDKFLTFYHLNFS